MSADNGNALFLPARKGGRVGVRFVGKADTIEQLHGAVFGFLFGFEFQRDRGERQVIQNVQIIEQVEMLEHHADIAAADIHVLKIRPIKLLHGFVVLPALVLFEQIIAFDIDNNRFVGCIGFHIRVIQSVLRQQFSVGFGKPDHVKMQIRVDRRKQFILKPNFTVGRLFQKVDAPKHGRFPASRRTDDGNFFAFLNVRGNAFEHLQFIKILVKAFDTDQRFIVHFSSSSFPASFAAG